MPETRKVSAANLLEMMGALAAQGQHAVSSKQLTEALHGSRATVNRILEQLCAKNQVIREGNARATRYRLAGKVTASTPSLELQKKLLVPLAVRDPVTYQRSFVESYIPNESSLLPHALAQDLAEIGRMQGQQPAGTYVRKVLEQLLIDLSWSSSRLEGNSYSLLATEQLFKSGIAGGDVNAVMLLNHKSAIEFLVDSVPTQGLTMGLIRNLHALLMQDLLSSTDALGAIRQTVVNISDTVYVPMQVPSILMEMLEGIIHKTRLIKNPIEAAFFIWVNVAYLQPFEDGNKRTSRLAANIPLMLYNRAPLSFFDVDQQMYAQAMLGVYEFRDVALAVDLFDWAYRRSVKKYAVVLESMELPDPMRLKYREALNEAIGLIVRDKLTRAHALQKLEMTEANAPGFSALLTDELKKLEVFNCARYRLAMHITEAWISAGRPQ